MKKYIITAAAVLSAVSFTACDDMLDTDPRVTEMTQATFPGKPADVEALNAGVYAIMNTMGGGDADTQNPYYWWEIMSDNCPGLLSMSINISFVTYFILVCLVLFLTGLIYHLATLEG